LLLSPSRCSYWKLQASTSLRCRHADAQEPLYDLSIDAHTLLDTVVSLSSLFWTHSMLQRDFTTFPFNSTTEKLGCTNPKSCVKQKLTTDKLQNASAHRVITTRIDILAVTTYYSEIRPFQISGHNPLWHLHHLRCCTTLLSLARSTLDDVIYTQNHFRSFCC